MEPQQDNIDYILTRNALQGIIRLADKFMGGLWALETVRRFGDSMVVMEFLAEVIAHGSKNVRVTIEIVRPTNLPTHVEGVKVGKRHVD